MTSLDRRTFLKASAGAAAGAALVASPAVAATSRRTTAKKAAPASRRRRGAHEPVVAWVRDARRGRVTVMSGTTERTVHDPVLVRRLLAAAR